jgi:IclR family transcriptional regulator, KDG regulon repressor
MNTRNKTKRKVIASIQRAINILNLFEENSPEMGNSEIARSLDMDTSTAAGIIYTLKLNHFIDQNPTNRKYRLGLKIAERASVLLNQLDLRKIAAPHLEQLRDWSGESVNLAILDNQDVVYIERLFGHYGLGIRSEVGKRSPVHSTALGKAIGAWLPAEELEILLDDYDFQAVTCHTITDRKSFNQELVKVRSQGYAIDDEENELGGRCIAVPILNHQDYPVAAISISVPIQKLPMEEVSVFGSKLKETSTIISEVIGFQK